jgi:DNA-binding MarR family transcriptional regulator
MDREAMDRNVATDIELSGDSTEDAAVGKTGAQKMKGRNGRPSAKQFRFGFLIHDVSRKRRTLIDHFMKPLGLTRSQWSLLSALSRSQNDGMMQVDLARLLEVGKVTVGGLIDRLEETGHIVRRGDVSDRRAKRIYVTEQGWEVIGKMIQVARKLNAQILEGIPAEDLEKTELSLMKVKENIKRALQARDK